MQVGGYSFGHLEVASQVHTSDLIITPDRVISPWWRSEGHSLSACDLRYIFDLQPEVIVLGTGYYGRMKVPCETRRELEERGMQVIATETGNAVDQFNRLQRDAARVVAALHLTC
jgi:hypothetical protein